VRGGHDRSVDYNTGVESARTSRRPFSLKEAQRLLPTVKRLTAEAAAQAEEIAAQLQETSATEPLYTTLRVQLDEIVRDWAGRMEALDLEVKGLWLVDFDTGQGYYCWQHPEPALAYYHDYDSGFAGRMRIV
jgi:hypothetical protein